MTAEWQRPPQISQEQAGSINRRHIEVKHLQQEYFWPASYQGIHTNTLNQLSVKDPHYWKYYEVLLSKSVHTEIIFFSHNKVWTNVRGLLPMAKPRGEKIFAIAMTTNSNNKNITTNSIRRTESSRPPPGWRRTKPTNPAHGARKGGQVSSLDCAHHLQRVDLQFWPSKWGGVMRMH